MRLGNADEMETVSTLIKLLLEEQFDLGLHCLLGPICVSTFTVPMVYHNRYC